MDGWEKTLHHALLRLAAERCTATYNELAALAAVPPPHRIHSLTLRLEDLIREDHAAGRPLLAALAVSRAQNGIPGPGFFQLLRELGRHQGPDRGAEAAACHQAELEAAWDYWGRSSTVYPNADDIKLWESLTSEEQAALIKRDLDEAEQSGTARSATMEDLIARARAKKR